MKFRYKQQIIVLAIAIFSLTACDKKAPPGKQARRAMPPAAVTVVEVHQQTVPETRELVGRLASTRVAQVRARVAGIILKRIYDEGTDVKKGQVLFKIDPEPLITALHAKQAALAKAKADATNAALTSKRYEKLARKNLISTQDLDSAQATERSTAAAVQQAQADVEKAKLDLSYATVTAPISGRAGRAMVTEGALVGQGEATELTTIEQVNPIYVNFSQSVSELSELQDLSAATGKLRVDVLLSDNKPYPHAGTVDFSDLAVDPATGAVSLRAILPNPDRRLLPGMFVKLRLSLGKISNAFLLPQPAVLRDHQGAYCYVVDKQDKVSMRRLTTHGMTSHDWIVTGQLQDGDHVITEGVQKVRPGGMAKPKLAKTPTNS